MKKWLIETCLQYCLISLMIDQINQQLHFQIYAIFIIKWISYKFMKLINRLIFISFSLIFLEILYLAMIQTIHNRYFFKVIMWGNQGFGSNNMGGYGGNNMGYGGQSGSGFINLNQGPTYMPFNTFGSSMPNYTSMNGYINVDYTQGWNPNYHDQLLRNNVDAVFLQYDYNRSGTLEGQQFFNAYRDLCLKMGIAPPSNYNMMYQAAIQIDKNQDGRISKKELYKLFKKIQRINEGYGYQPGQVWGVQGGWNQQNQGGWGQQNQGFGQQGQWGNQGGWGQQNQGFGQQGQWGNQGGWGNQQGGW